MNQLSRNRLSVFFALTVCFLPYLYSENLVDGEQKSWETGDGKNYSITLPRMKADMDLSEITIADEPLENRLFISAFLIASGLKKNSAEYRRYFNVYLDVIKKCPENDPEKILVWMHSEILNRYKENQTLMNVLPDTGNYNCVSSALLYTVLARDKDININGVLTHDHAFCKIVFPDGKEADVETTSAMGFDPGKRKEAVDSFTGRTGFIYVPPGNYRDRSDISDKEFISLIYQNRVSLLQKQGRWQETVPLSLDRLALARSSRAASDFLTSISNFAAQLDKEKKDIEGLLFLNSASEAFLRFLKNIPDPGKFTDAADAAGKMFSTTSSALIGNAVYRLLAAGDTDEAEELVLDKELTALVPKDFLSDLYTDIKQRGLSDSLKNNNFETALSDVENAYSSGIISVSKYSEYVIYLYSSEARKKSEGNNWLAAWLFLSDAPGRYRRLSGWSRMENVYSHNAQSIFHNNFVSLVNKKQYAEAGKVLQEALGYFPESRLLNQDKVNFEQLLKTAGISD